MVDNSKDYGLLTNGARLMRVERLAERMECSWDFRLRNRAAIERFLTRHELTYNQVRDYGVAAGILDL
jgi:hypothetical protein